jgi:hypothetical protein
MSILLSRSGALETPDDEEAVGGDDGEGEQLLRNTSTGVLFLTGTVVGWLWWEWKPQVFIGSWLHWSLGKYDGSESAPT